MTEYASLYNADDMIVWSDSFYSSLRQQQQNCKISKSKTLQVDSFCENIPINVENTISVS